MYRCTTSIIVNDNRGSLDVPLTDTDQRMRQQCRARGLPVDSSASRAQYAAESVQLGDGLPYYPDQPLWPLGVTMIALRSELGPQLSASVQSPLVRQFVHNLTQFVGTREGRYRTVVVASRYRTCDYAQLWQYFSQAVGSQNDLMFDDAFLSVSDTVRHEGQTLYVTDYGQHDPVKTVCGLAAVGHGLAGIEYLGDKQRTIRVFDISPQRCDLKATANRFHKGVVKVADNRFTLSYYER